MTDNYSERRRQFNVSLECDILSFLQLAYYAGVIVPTITWNGDGSIYRLQSANYSVCVKAICEVFEFDHASAYNVVEADWVVTDAFISLKRNDILLSNMRRNDTCIQLWVD